MQYEFSFKRLFTVLAILGALALVAHFTSPPAALKDYAHAEVDPQDPSRFNTRTFDYNLIVDDFGTDAGGAYALYLLKHGQWSTKTDPKQCAQEDARALMQAAEGSPIDFETSRKAGLDVGKVLVSTFNDKFDRRREYAEALGNALKAEAINLAGQ